eukprot:TCONS_00055136-protein
MDRRVTFLKFFGIISITFAIRYELIGQNKKPNKPPYSIVNVKFEQHCFSKCHHDEKCASFLIQTTSKDNPITCHFYNTTTTNLIESQTALQGTKLYTDIQDCRDLYHLGYKASGIYSLNLPGGVGTKDVRCDMENRGGGWMVFTYRMIGQHDWNADWETYKNGFGEHPGDFYIGNEILHKITTSGDYEFYYISEDLETGQKYNGWYEHFYIESESDLYRLRLLGNSEGTVNTLNIHNNRAFSTIDRDNDNHETTFCARDTRKGANWWYRCGQFSPFGRFHDTTSAHVCMGVETIPKKCSKYFQMMFRRR